MSPSIVRNTTLMMIASICQKIISLAYFTIIARKIGPTNIGIYTSALAMTTIFVIFVDLGFTNVFIRESAREKKDMQKMLSSVLGAKLFCGLISYIVMFLTLKALNFEPEFTFMVCLSGITMLFDSLNLTTYGALRAENNLKYESYAIIASQFLSLVIGLISVYLGLPLYFLILAFTIPSALNAVYSATILHAKYNLSIMPSIEKKELKRIGLMSLPFAMAAVFGRIYSYVDVVMLKKIAGNAAAGIYSTPSKITFAFQFIPMALTASLYPRFSQYFTDDKEKLKKVFVDSLRYLLIIAIPISVGISLLSRDIVILFFTDKYAPSILPLKILIISLVFSFVSFPIGSLLNACNKQNIQTSITGIILAINLILNLFLIPRFSAVGASITALVCNILLAVLGYIFSAKTINLPQLQILKLFAKALICAIAMGAVLFFIDPNASIIAKIFLGATVYVLMIFATKTITLNEAKEVISLIKK